MRVKLLTGAAALALTACTVLATVAPASAAPRGWHGGWRGGGGWSRGGLGWGGIAAGAAIAAATAPLWGPNYYDYTYGYGPYDGGYGPGYGYGAYSYGPSAPMVAEGGGGVAWCQANFRSYNPATGLYLGYDGQYHPCS
jgi:hypothetical protein